MIVTQSAGAVQGSFYDLWYTVAQYVPQILAAVVVFLIGWIVGIILYRVVVEIVRVLRIDDALRAAGMHDAAKQAGFNLNAGKFLGRLVEWFVILVFLIAALELLGLVRVTIALQTIVLLYMPQVMVAALIIILGAIVAEVVRGLIAHSGRATGAHGANLAGTIAKYAILAWAVMAALQQIGIAADMIQTLFTGIVVAISLAFGLSFGLGGKEAASRTIERIRSEISHNK